MNPEGKEFRGRKMHTKPRTTAAVRRLRIRDAVAHRESGSSPSPLFDEHATIQVILPRRKAGQAVVDRDTVEPVVLNRALLQSLFHLPLATASSRLVREPSPAPHRGPSLMPRSALCLILCVRRIRSNSSGPSTRTLAGARICPPCQALLTACALLFLPGLERDLDQKGVPQDRNHQVAVQVLPQEVYVWGVRGQTLVVKRLVGRRRRGYGRVRRGRGGGGGVCG